MLKARRVCQGGQRSGDTRLGAHVLYFRQHSLGARVGVGDGLGVWPGLGGLHGTESKKNQRRIG